MKTIFFSVGEPSGDLHGSNLIRYIRQHTDRVSFVGYGGPKMAGAGCELHEDLTKNAVMGFFRVLKHVPHLRKLVRRAKQYFDTQPPDAVVLIDYPGFNWWIARAASERGIPVFYYGVPQLWAWAQWRVKKMQRWVDYPLCKLPFEEKWLRENGVDATYVGHPYFDQLHDQVLDQVFIDNFFHPGGGQSGPGITEAVVKQQHGSDTSENHSLLVGKHRDPLVLILPGSRRQEVYSNLHWFYKAAAKVKSQIPQTRFVVAAFNGQHAEKAREMAGEVGLDVEVYVGRTQELMVLADCAMACSGSVSLELMYHRLPTVVLYWINLVNDLLQRVLRKVKYITLVNLLAVDNIHPENLAPFDPDSPDADEVVFPEYLTRHDKSSEMAGHIVQWLSEPDTRQQVVDRLDQLNEKFGLPGASVRAAQFILDKLEIPIEEMAEGS